MTFPFPFMTRALSAVSPPLTLTFVSAENTTAATSATTAAYPTCTAGDLIVVGSITSGTSFGSPPVEFPTGFTTVVAETTTSPFTKSGMAFKIADGSETGNTFTVTSNSTGTRQYYWVIFSGPCLTATSGMTWNSQYTTGNPSSQTVTSGSSPQPKLVVIGFYYSSGAVDPRTFSPAKDGEYQASTARFIAYKTYLTSPANVSIDMDDEGNNFLASGYIYCT